MCSNYPEIKSESALGTLEDKIEHLSSYAHVVHATAKQVISRRRKNENVYKMSKNEKCTCKNTICHCQICKFVGFLLPSSSWLLTFADDVPMKTLNLTNIFLTSVLLYTNRNQRLEQTCLN